MAGARGNVPYIILAGLLQDMEWSDCTMRMVGTFTLCCRGKLVEDGESGLRVAGSYILVWGQ